MNGGLHKNKRFSYDILMTSFDYYSLDDVNESRWVFETSEHPFCLVGGKIIKLEDEGLVLRTALEGFQHMKRLGWDEYTLDIQGLRGRVDFVDYIKNQ
jgi:hypothetical protein